MGVGEETILQKVQKLIDKALSTTFEAEKQALLAKADELMVKYSIDQLHLLDPNRPNTASYKGASEPELREIWYFGDSYTQTDVSADLMDSLSTLFWHLAHHLHVRIGYYGWRNSKVVGYPADLDFLQMMFLSVKLDMASKLDPEVNPAIPWEDNLAAFKHAGYKWERMHSKLQRHPNYKFKDQPWTRPIGVQFTAVYRKWIEAHPEAVRNKSNPKQWRESFIMGYVYEIRERLAAMRRATMEGNPNLPALVDNKKSLVEQKFLELFPPPPKVETTGTVKTKAVRQRTYKGPNIDYTAFGAGRTAAATADLSGANAKVGNRKDALG